MRNFKFDEESVGELKTKQRNSTKEEIPAIEIISACISRKFLVKSVKCRSEVLKASFSKSNFTKFLPTFNLLILWEINFIRQNKYLFP